MQTRFRLVCRGNRGDTFYCVDKQSGKRSSLGNVSLAEARQIVHARNEAERQPLLNLQLARAYLAGTDSAVTSRTWRDAILALTETKRAANQTRWQTVLKDPALAPLWSQVIIQTPAQLLLRIISSGTVSTNVYLRRLHNFCLDMGWLAWPVLHKQKRAITLKEHQAIVAGESNAELRDFYELLWHTGASQTDLATLRCRDINWQTRTISYARMKTRTQAVIRFGEDAASILQRRALGEVLFPQVSRWKESDRAKAFIRRCRLVGVQGVSLHSYRYAWAERALTAGYPERFAQLALGHNSKAVHRAYARNAQVTLPPLEEYERALEASRVVRLLVEPAPAEKRAHSSVDR